MDMPLSEAWFSVQCLESLLHNDIPFLSWIFYLEHTLSSRSLSSVFSSPGVLRVWEASSSQCVFTQTLPAATPSVQDGAEDDGHPRSLTYCLPMPVSGGLAMVTAEHNILLYRLHALCVQQQASPLSAVYKLWLDSFHI